MEISTLLNEDVQKFIISNNGTNLSLLALKKNPFPNIDYKQLLNQIECRQKSEKKLPTWFATKNIIYPTKISIEQTSSEQTAKYKSEIASGQALIDLSGGFGVDSYYFSKTFATVTHCELNEDLSTRVKHNFTYLDAQNVNCYAGDSLEILKKINKQFDCIYIDPSRRNDKKGKVFLLEDCIPNVPNLLNHYFKYSDVILIKTAPILDITAGLNELKYVKNIHIIAIENDVKELIWEINYNYTAEIKVITRNFTKQTVEAFDFILNETTTAEYALPEKILYEPNSCIMKSGGFNQISTQFGLKKLHQHSHLYTSNEIKSFPGRVFQINNVIPYSKNTMKTHFANSQKNITFRNFPDTVENIRKKWNIKEGGNHYCFFTTDVNNNKIVLICTKIDTIQ